MKKTIHLDSLEGVPEKLLAQLGKYDTLFEAHPSLEHLIAREPGIGVIIGDINSYCETKYIKGYHYTRATPSEILQHGLLSRSGDEIRNTFLEHYGERFSTEELLYMKEQWDIYFRGAHQRQARDYRVFFNTTTSALNNRDAELLLNYYGGEQVHRPLDGKEHLLGKLSLIGSPLMVSFSVRASEAQTYGPDDPWGMTAVSSYHRLINPEAHQVYIDGYVANGIGPDDIIEVRSV